MRVRIDMDLLDGAMDCTKFVLYFYGRTCHENFADIFGSGSGGCPAGNE